MANNGEYWSIMVITNDDNDTNDMCLSCSHRLKAALSVPFVHHLLVGLVGSAEVSGGCASF